MTGVKLLLEKIIDSLDPIHALHLLRSTWLPVSPALPNHSTLRPCRTWSQSVMVYFWKMRDLSPLPRIQSS